jgi:hypothetical protein
MIIGNWKFTAGAFACAPRRFPIFSLLSFLTLSIALALDPAAPPIQINQNSLSGFFPLSYPSDLTVYELGSKQPLFGSVTKRHGTLTFVPTVPFIEGTTYRIEHKVGNGTTAQFQVTLERKDFVQTFVSLSPDASSLPANTLKLYLDFTEPMEHGVFLIHTKLWKQSGQEVTGAFRESELWSPDGKRLTLMFHPGRQKTGVNLNVDEGPVLIAGESYQLTISGRWRTVKGDFIGIDGKFHFAATAADHSQPDPEKWQLKAPKAGTREPLQIITDELFEPQIFQRALKLNLAGTAQTELLPTDLISWTFTPEKPWQPGRHEINIDPELEDLAGNSIAKPFEIDLTAPKPVAKTTRLHFHLP